MMARAPGSDENDENDDEVAVVEVGDVLDLHLFAPRDVAGLVRDYLDECLAQGLAELRIIHGKGIGNLRRTVHSVLDRHPGVERYALADGSGGGWGATLVTLRKA